MGTDGTILSSQCQLASHYVAVTGAKLHYYEAGKGDPILFLHGIPASAYLWRNIIPSLASHARCIAPDLIGMGLSDKPDIEYHVTEHIAYINAFIDALQLKNITLVLHGWGSVIGFDYAKRHPERVKAIAFYESHVRPVTDWKQLSLPVQQVATLLNRPGASYRAVIKQNYLVEKMLPRSTIRALSEETMSHYRAPFTTPESRKPLWQYLNELPLGKNNGEADAIIREYAAFLEKSDAPKLLLYAIPGFMTTMDDVRWVRQHFPNTTLACLDDALHLAQESLPELFSSTIETWYKKL